MQQGGQHQLSNAFYDTFRMDARDHHASGMLSDSVGFAHITLATLLKEPVIPLRPTRSLPNMVATSKSILYPLDHTWQDTG